MHIHARIFLRALCTEIRENKKDKNLDQPNTNLTPAVNWRIFQIILKEENDNGGYLHGTIDAT